MIGAPDIAGLITFLQIHDPSALAQLHTKYTRPAEQHDASGGDSKPDPGRLIVKSNVRKPYPRTPDLATDGSDKAANAAMYVEVAIRSLQAAVDRAGPNTRQLRTRLGRAKTLRTIGSALAAFTGAGLVGVLLAGQRGVVPSTTAVVNFASSLAVLWAGHLESALHGGKGSLIDIFEQVTGATVRAEQLIQTLKLHRATGPDSPEAMAAVKDANALTVELRIAEERLWG